MRRTITITIPGVHSDKPGERDNGKVFEITEMPADAAERWCLRARILLAEATNQPMPEASDSGEAAALAAMGIQFNNLRIWRALSSPDLDEVWNYIQYRHKAGQPALPITTGENSVIEEIDTRLRLRSEALMLNLGFSKAAERRESAAEPVSTAA
jgi:hypothetical protein